MSGEEHRSRSVTAGELQARLERDPEWVRRRAEAVAEREKRHQQLLLAQQPIVRELRSVGVAIESVWDLVNTSAPYPDALPILLKHLVSGGYPDRVMEGLGRALAVRPSAFAWDTLRQHYLSAQGRGEEVGLAVALAASATPRHFDDLVALLHEDSRGDTRILFLRTIKRIGGARGLAILEALAADPLFGREAQALLKRRKGLAAKPSS